MIEHNKIVTLGGIKFRIEKINESYYIAVPVDDPHWMMKYMYGNKSTGKK